MNNPSRRKAVGILAVFLVAVTLVYSLTRVGHPAGERERRLDERRLEDLREIARAVDLHWTRHGNLPAALDRLSDGTERDVALRDPESGDSYAYRVHTDSVFELCGVFATDWSPPSVDLFWSHPMGRHCFQLEVREVHREESDHGRSTTGERIPADGVANQDGSVEYDLNHVTRRFPRVDPERCRS